jgi:hypothetical protein
VTSRAAIGGVVAVLIYHVCEKGAAMKTDSRMSSGRRREDNDDDDRAGFFLFPIFRGRRMEAIPPFLLMALFLWWGLYVWTPPAPPPPQAPAMPAEVTAARAPEPVAVTTERWGGSVVFPIEGKDSAGKHAAFDVAVLPKDLAWVSKSSSNLSLAGQQIPDDQLAEKLFTPELRDGLSKSKQVMAIGLASQEGQVEEETARALARAQTAAKWLSDAVAPEIGVWMLNLGQFKKSGCPAQTETPDTSWQRPVILVGVKSQDEGVNLTEAFADALGGKSNLPSRDCYTSFDLTRVR